MTSMTLKRVDILMKELDAGQAKRKKLKQDSDRQLVRLHNAVTVLREEDNMDGRNAVRVERA